MRIAKLPAERWRDYRKLRLEALRSDPLAFGSSASIENGFAEEKWKELIDNVLFALEHEEPLGMIVFAFDDRPKHKHIANIYGFYVGRSHRGRGVGTSLLEGALSQIQQRKGIVKVKLGVNAEQAAAIGIYERVGFVVAGRTRKELKIGRKFYDVLIMEKLF